MIIYLEATLVYMIQTGKEKEANDIIQSSKFVANERGIKYFIAKETDEVIKT